MHDSTSNSPPKAAASCVAVALACGLALAQPVRELPTGDAFVIDQPAATASRAARVTWGWQEMGRAVDTERGWWMLSRVIVRTGGVADGAGLVDADAVRAAAADAGFADVRVRRTTANGWLVARAASVEDAVRLAEVLDAMPGVARATVATQRPWSLRTIPNDPLLPNQWYLRNTDPAEAMVDANVDAAWAQGLTGTGVQIGIVEAGFSRTHEDLAPNFRADLSQVPIQFTSHGTSVAGVAAAKGDNGLGIAGAAHQADLAELYFGTDEETAAAFLHAIDQIDIKNNSFGPPDDGTGHVASQIELDALEQATRDGRGGLGTIFVWAAGNGGEDDDRGDYDPYASSRFTIAVNAIDDDDNHANYAEPSSGVLVATHSSGDRRDRNTPVTTTGGENVYNSSFGGTSAAAPLASGVIALMLEANPALTWRDVQHVLVESARVVDTASEGWTTNGAGRMVHTHNGFGAVDAGAATALAATWSPVAPATSETVEAEFGGSILLPDNDQQATVRTIDVPAGITLEHVELQLDIDSGWQGDLRITMTSPAGTVSRFATPRLADNGNNYSQRLFTSVRQWGEDSGGTWTVAISDEQADFTTTWAGFTLTVHGTAASLACSPADLTDPEGGAPDGAITLADFTAYLGGWMQADIAADLTTRGSASGIPDGAVDLSDFSYYLTLWSAGCP